MFIPDFLIQHLKIHKTSLGDNPCFPNETEYPYDYKIIKERYEEVMSEMQKFGSIDLVTAKNIFSKLLEECKQKEKPIRDMLNEICKKSVEEMLFVPDGIVLFDCQLIDKVEPNNTPRLMPEDGDDENTYNFDDVNDIEQAEKSVLKRRFINSMIQGAANTYARREDIYGDEIEKIDDSLLELYNNIMILNDFILFNDEEHITEKNYSPNAYVEVSLGAKGYKTTIKAQGTIFPFLLQESVRGFFELFASHSLPQDNDKAKYLIHHADFILAENWDLRFGVKLWEEAINLVEDESVIPFYFRNLCKLPTDEFNSTMKEILSHTKKGFYAMSNLIMQSENEMTDSDIPNIEPHGDVRGVLSDSVNDEDMMSLEELDEMVLEDNDYKEYIQTCATYIYAKGQDGEWNVLGGKRGSTAPSAPNMYNVPVGYREFNETPQECARRETYEETGLNLPLGLLHYIGKEEYRPNTFGANFAVMLDKPIEQIRIGNGDGENSRFQWIPITMIHKFNWAFGMGETATEIFDGLT